MSEKEDDDRMLNDAGSSWGTGESADVERWLLSLKTGESRLNRDQVMFRAGEASAQVQLRPSPGTRVRWTLPATVLASMCAGIFCGVLISNGLVAHGPVGPSPSLTRSVPPSDRSNAHPTTDGARSAARPRRASANEIAAAQPKSSFDEGVLQAEVDSGSPLTVAALRVHSRSARWKTAATRADHSAESSANAATYRSLQRRLLEEADVDHL